MVHHLKAPSLECLQALRRILGPPHTQQRYVSYTRSHTPFPAPIPAPRNCASSRHAFSSHTRRALAAPKSKDRGPPSQEKTMTDFGNLNVLGSVPPPTTSVDACMPNGFRFNSGLNILDGAGCLIVAGEVFSWRPWRVGGNGKVGMVNRSGQWQVKKEALGLLDLLWPKPGKHSNGHTEKDE